MNAYRLAVCDDEAVFLSSNRQMAASILREAGVDCHIETFASAKALFERLAAEPDCFDMLLLDILLGDGNGVELAKSLRATGYQGGILFATSSPDYALEGYRVHPAHYLLKPLSRADLRDALLRDCDARMHAPSISVPIKGGFATISLSSILYVEALLRSVIFHTKDRDTESPIALKEALALLSKGAFLQCHRGFLVPVGQIRDLTRAGIELKSGHRVPIGRAYYDETLASFINHLQG